MRTFGLCPRLARQNPAGGSRRRSKYGRAIAGTASNTNTNPIATLDLAISDPPAQGELQQVLAGRPAGAGR
jgi:hypothetical protein